MRKAVGLSLVILGGCSAQAESPGGFEAVGARPSPVVTGGYAYNAGDGLADTYGEAPPGVVEDLAPEALAALRGEDGAPQVRGALVERPVPGERASRLAAALPQRELVTVGIVLPDDGADLAPFQDADDERLRLTLISQRRARLRPAQERIEAAVADLGGEVVRSQWLVNMVTARVEARHVAQIARWPGVEEVFLDEGTPLEPTSSYSGLETREGMRLDGFLDHGVDGSGPGRAGGNVKIGIFDAWSYGGYENWPVPGHVGWLDWDGGPSRLRFRECPSTGTLSGSGCVTVDDPPEPGNYVHGTGTTWVAAGSIEEGQDPYWSGDDAVYRSGIAREADVYYSRVFGCPDIVDALDQAVADGVDVVNISLSMGPGCDVTFECFGVGLAIKNATDAGVLVVHSAGNGGQTGDCNLFYPAWRPDVLSVGGLDSGSTFTDYDSMPIWSDLDGSGSSTGSVQIWRHDGTTGASYRTAGIGLMAPAKYNWNFYLSPNMYQSDSSIRGTSYAAPAVAGSAALLRDAFNSLGWGGMNDARFLQVNMLLLGDTWDAERNTDRRIGVSSWSGFGRVHLHRPSSDDLVAPWGWGYRAVWVRNGETHRFNVGGPGMEAAAVNQWKAAAAWYEKDLTSTAEIRMAVVDTCAAGGPVTVAMDYSKDFRKRLHLTRRELQGRCLELQLIGVSVPAEGRLVYVADYFHSGDPADH